jgi:DNA polymerase I
MSYIYTGKSYKGEIQNHDKDVYIAAQLEEYERDNSLENLAKILLKTELTTENMGKVIDMLGEYFEKNLPSSVLWVWRDIETPIENIVFSMQKNGIFLDIASLASIQSEITQNIEILEKNIKKSLDTDTINLNSTQQLAEVLAQKGFNLGKKTKTGKFSTGKDVLDQLEQTDNTGLIRTIKEYRSRTKLLSSFIEPMLEKVSKDGRLRGEFHQIGAATGRMSTSNPSLQNIPVRNDEYAARIRGCFTAPTDHTLIVADYSQIELRILAHLTQDPVLMDAFKNNQDVHARSASEIFDIPLEKVTKQQRNIGKTLNFALMYQQGAFSTAKLLGVTVEEAKQYTERFFAKFATIKPFTEKVLEDARAQGYVESMWGRRRYFNNLKSKNFFLRSFEERAAFNAVIQASEADLVKKGMLAVDEVLKKAAIDMKWILQIHDEIIIEVQEKDANHTLEIVQTALKLNQPLVVPIEIDAEISAHWS